MPNDVVTWRRRALLFPANLLFFAAKLDEAFKLGRAAHTAQREGRFAASTMAGCHPTRRHRRFPNMIEQLEALQGALDSAEEQRDRAEAQADYFAEMFDKVATKAKLSQAEIAAIRAEARAKREPQVEDGEDD